MVGVMDDLSYNFDDNDYEELPAEAVSVIVCARGWVEFKVEGMPSIAEEVMAEPWYRPIEPNPPARVRGQHQRMRSWLVVGSLALVASVLGGFVGFVALIIAGRG
jgi:hypothetical protein